MSAQPKLAATTEYKIEKGVPMPGTHGNSKYPFEAMEVGDSVVIPIKSRAAASSWFRSRSRKYTSRPVDDSKVRIWRVS